MLSVRNGAGMTSILYCPDCIGRGYASNEISWTGEKHYGRYYGMGYG